MEISLNSVALNSQIKPQRQMLVETSPENIGLIKAQKIAKSQPVEHKNRRSLDFNSKMTVIGKTA